MAPPYLENLINHFNPTRPLRSANTRMLTVPSLKTLGQKSTCPSGDENTDCDLPVDNQGCASRLWNMPLGIKKGLSATFMASKIGKPPVQCFVQNSLVLQTTLKTYSTTPIQNRMKTFSHMISPLR